MLKKLKGLLERKQDGEVVGIASTEVADRDNEIIKQAGWDLANFMQNPVILAHHNYHNFPIGKATDIAVENGKLMFKMVFSKATEEAQQAYELVKEGILNTFSVGYIPREYDPQNQNITTKAELLEISLVAVPANPQAIVVAKGLKNNEIAKGLIKEWLKDEKMKQEVEKLEEKEEVKGAVQDELNAEQIYEMKGEKLRDVYDIMWAFYDVYWKEETTVEQFETLLAETIGLLQKVADGTYTVKEKKSVTQKDRGEEFKKFILELSKKDSTSGVGNDETAREESGEVEAKLLEDPKFLKELTGNLQKLCSISKKGGVKK